MDNRDKELKKLVALLEKLKADSKKRHEVAAPEEKGAADGRNVRKKPVLCGRSLKGRRQK